MIYNEDDVTLGTKMHETMFPTGQPEVMTEMIETDGPYIRRLCLKSEYVERFHATAEGVFWKGANDDIQ